MSAIGGVLSGSIGVQGHYANGLAALFIACGQDAACVAESAVGVTRFEPIEGGSLYASVTLPNLIVGTVGGGTSLPEPARLPRHHGARGPGARAGVRRGRGRAGAGRRAVDHRRDRRGSVHLRPPAARPCAAGAASGDPLAGVSARAVSPARARTARRRVQRVGGLLLVAGPRQRGVARALAGDGRIPDVAAVLPAAAHRRRVQGCRGRLRGTGRTARCRAAW